MSLKPNRAEYWVGEPVVLRARIMNWLSPTLMAYGIFGLQGDDTELHVVHDNEWGEPYRAYFERTPTTPSNLVLKYAKAFDFRVTVLYSKDAGSGLIMEAPGEYTFAMRQALRYTNPYDPSRVVSPQFMTASTDPIRVVEPPEQAAGALAMIKGYPSIVRDMNRQLATPGNQRILEKIAYDYPDSRYAPYCLHALGNLYDLYGNVYPPHLKKAEKYFKELADNYLDYPFRNEVRLSLALIYRDTGRLDQGVAIVEKMIAEDEDNIYRFRKSEIMKPYRGAVPNPYAETNELGWYLFDTTEYTCAYLQAAAEMQE